MKETKLCSEWQKAASTGGQDQQGAGAELTNGLASEQEQKEQIWETGGTSFLEQNHGEICDSLYEVREGGKCKL